MTGVRVGPDQTPERSLPELLARRAELLRQSWEMVCTPMPSGEQAGYAFDAAHDEIEREIEDVEREIKSLLGVRVGEPYPQSFPGKG